MFAGATAFDRDQRNWRFEQKSLNSFLDNSGLSCSNYSKLLSSMATYLPSNATNVTMGAANLQYGKSATQARNYLSNTLNWNITGDGKSAGTCMDTTSGYAFTTLWDLTENGSTNNSISFTLDHSDSVFYYWETYPGKRISSNGFLKDSILVLDSLPADSVVRLFLFPYGIRSFSMQGSPDVLRLKTVSSWGKTPWQQMDFMFQNCTNLEINATDIPDIRAVESLHGMFRGCVSLQKIPLINKWDVSHIQDLSYFLDSAIVFNDTLSDWNTSAVQRMEGVFKNAASFNNDVSQWNTGNVSTFESMFDGALSFNQPLFAWNMSNAKTMKKMFRKAHAFNQKVETWSLDSIQDISYLFQHAISFNQPIELMDISRLTSLEGLFAGASSFNQPLQQWDVSEILTFSNMFNGAIRFNQNLNNWDMRKAVSLDSMFKNAITFNQNITKWNTLRVTNMSGMFSGASSFDQNLGSWLLRPNIVLDDMLDSSGLSCVNYSSTLIGWAAAAPITSKTLGAAGLGYGTNASSSRNVLLSRSWSIQGDRNTGVACIQPAFISRWDLSIAGSNDSTLSLPIVSTGPVSFFWEEQSPGSASGQGVSQGDSIYINDLPSKSTITLHVLPNNLSQIKIDQHTDKDRLIAIEQWGTTTWTSMEKAFKGCQNLQITANGNPLLNNAQSLNEMFAGCVKLNSPSTIGTWNVSNIQQMKGMFDGAVQFNQSIANWNVSNVVDFSYMFHNAHAFNQSIGNWNTRKAQNVEGMFSHALSFSQNIQNWNTELVETTAYMFDSAILFSADLSKWNVAKVNTMEGMFKHARSFHSDLSSWNTGACLSFKNTFSNALLFESDLDQWSYLPNVSLEGFLDSTALSCLQYSSLLIKWADSLSGVQNKQVGAKGLIYGTSADESRTKLIQLANWNIVGDQMGNASCAPTDFITLWDLTKPGSGQRRISFGITSTDTVHYTWKSYPGGVFKGSGKVFGNTLTITNLPADSIIQLAVSPQSLNGIAVGMAGDTLRLVEVMQWGIATWTKLDKAFKGCKNVQFTNRFMPDFKRLISVSEMFAETPGIVYPSDLPHWTMDSVSNFRAMFRGCTTFNEDVTQWNTFSAKDMSYMFAGASAFNKPIGNWNTNSVENMEHMLEAASSFSESLEQWNVASVSSMKAMFKQAIAFKGKLQNWNTQNVVSMQSMFEGALLFNGEIDSWNLSSLTNASKMFKNATEFNRSLSTWDVSNIASMQEIFANATSFNQNLGAWKLRNNADLSKALDSCGIDMFNYDSTLIQWLDFGAENVTLGAQGLVYCAAAPGRFVMTQTIGQSGLNWTITGDSALAVTPFIPEAKTAVIPAPICGNSYLNPQDITQKLIEFDPNGNSTGERFFKVFNNAVDSIPAFIANDSGYYSFADTSGVWRVGHLLYQLLTEFNPDSNGFKVKVYYDSALFAAQEISVPSQTSLTNAGWFMVFTDSTSDFFGASIQNTPYKWLTPDETGVEQGVHYAVFTLDSGGVVGYASQYSKLLNNDPIAFEKTFSIKVYPNPASNQLTVEIPQLNHATFIEFIGIDGKIVQVWDVNNAVSHLKLAHHPPGTYILRVKIQGKIINHKVIVAE
jgi:hypothetical protein